MKTRINIVLSLGLLTLFTSCDHDVIYADGEVTSMYHNIGNYQGVKISDAFHAYVNFSDTEEEIRIAANDNLHEKIIVEKNEGVLVIQLKNHTTVKGGAVTNVYITTNNISSFQLDGASKLTLENEWNVQEGEVKVSGASDFDGEIVTDHLEIYMEGASSANILGNVSTLDANLSGSSNLMDFGLSASNLDIVLSGASTAFLSVEETISIKASGASTFYYKGGANILKSELSGSSSIIKED